MVCRLKKVDSRKVRNPKRIGREKMNFKKITSVAVSTLLAASMLVGCSSSAAATTNASSTGSASTKDVSFDKIKVAVVLNSTAEVNMVAEKYLTNVVSPLLNIDFMFSEVVSDASALTAFIENAYAAGCVGVFNTAGSNVQAAQAANDLGMYVVNNSTKYEEDVKALPYYLSNTGTSATLNSEAYSQALDETLKTGEKHNVLVLTGAASLGSTSMVEAAKGILNGLKDKYGLKYSKDVADLAVVDAQTDVDTGTDMKVTIFPGVPRGADYASAISSILQTGTYDVVISTISAYSYLSVAMDEVEKAKNMDIKFITQDNISDSMTTAFNTKDATGDSIVNCIVCSSMSEQWTLGAIQIRNAMDGFADAMRPSGNAGKILVRPFPVSSAETYNKLAADTIPASFMTTDEILNLCDKVNANATSQSLSDFAGDLTIENILKKFSK
jgi:hypothetical protein